MHQYATLADTVYFWFAVNDTTGAGADGATPVYDVRLGGGAASDAPIVSGSATLLTHANYPDGCHEIAVAATGANGFVAGNTYGVFCTVLVSAVNPTGFVGSFSLKPVVADLRQILGAAITGTAAQIVAAFTKWFNVATPTGTVNSLPDAVAGAANGVFIAGTNAPVTITGSGDALTITSTGGNGDGIQVTGNGSGYGARISGGATATSKGVSITGEMYGLDVVGDLGVRMVGSVSQGLKITSDGSTSTVYLEGPTGGGVALYLSSPQGGVEWAYASCILFESQNGHPAIRFYPQNATDVLVNLGGGKLGADLITSAVYDESTAYPLASADTGSTAVARTGADSDTLETLSDQLDTVTTNVNTLLSRVTANLFSGITYMKNWLALIMGKTADATTLAEVNATTAGTTYANTTDSLEANRDNIGTAGAGLTSVTPAVAISAAQAASVASGTIAIRAYHTLSQAITSTTTSDLSAATKVWLAIKNEAEDTDAQSVVFIEATGGLTYLAGAAYTTTTDGTMVVTGSSGAWIITVTLQEAATALLSAYDGKTLLAELKALVSGNTVAVWDGTATVSYGIVRAYA